MSEKIKIAFVTASDPLDKKSWSGTYYQMYQNLKKVVYKVDCIGPIPLFFIKTMAIINRVFIIISGKRYNYKNSIILSYIHSKYIQFKLKGKKYDYIFAPAASTEIAYLDTNIPIIYCSDSSFGQMNEYYDAYSDLFDFSVEESNKIEQKAIGKASYISYPSNWAKDYILEHYKTDAKIKVIPYGANIDESCIDFESKKILKDEVVNILFLGVDWYRKGGDLVYDTFLKLIEAGYNIHLTVCGCVPPVKHAKIKVIPFLNKNKEIDLKKLSTLFKESHFLFLPSKAECFGIVFCEASAYGLPSISRNTGGITDAIINDVNGFYLNQDASSGDYFELLVKYIEQPELYSKLSNSSRKLYIEKLNWNIWTNELLKMIKK